MIRRAIVLAVLLIVGGGASSAASPNFLVDNPVRPADSRLLTATTGIFVSYELTATDSLLSAKMTMLDEITNKKRTFTLSFRTKLNGATLECSDDGNAISSWVAAAAVRKYRLCSKLPNGLQSGKTRVTLVYWPHVYAKPPSMLKDFDTDPATDEIWIVPGNG